MFKVMIVEDEPPILRTVKNVIENTNPEFKVAACCINGKNAVEALQKEDFDIVITDIKMPVMTGLELAGWIYENKPETMVIILSGYSDFEYARKALEYKVFDYLLKPVSRDKVKELLDRITIELGAKKSEASHHSDECNTVIILACAGAYLLYGSEVMLPGESFWSDERIECFMDKNLTASEGYIFFNTNIPSERFVVVESDSLKRQEEIVYELYDFFKNGELPITIIYKKDVRLKDAGQSLSMLREQLIKTLILDKPQLICCDSISESYENIELPYSKDDIDEITSFIKLGKTDRVREKLSSVLEIMRETECTQEEVNGFLNIILDTYMLNYPRQIERKNTSVKREFVNALAGFVSYDSFIEDIVSILMTFRSDSKNTDRYAKLADSVEDYLINNYNKNITNNILAKEFGFVPSYISRIFKRRKGMSPNEYMTRYRIDLAKKLILKNPDMLVKDIADFVGFKDSYYFSKTFKRETGLWPSEF
jgi:YesN/AraC family two-component response regulator